MFSIVSSVTISIFCIVSSVSKISALRAAPRKYRLNLEIAKKSNFSKLAQNEALRALVTKILF